MSSATTLKRSLILSFVAAATLPILTISFLVLYDLTGERTRDIDEKNLLLAKAVSGQVEGFLREPQATLQSLGGFLQSHPGMSDKEIQELLTIIVKNSALFESIYVLDPGGETRYIGLRPERSNLSKDFIGINMSHMPFFQKTVATGEPAWSDTFFSVISGEISLAITLPIENGVLVGNFSIRPLSKFLKKLHQAESIIISIVDRNGTTIAHPDPIFAAQQIHVGHLAPVRAALQGKEETLHYSFEHKEYIGSSILIPGPNWAILVSQTTANAYQQVRNTGILFVIGAIGAFLLSLFFSLSKAFRISRSLSELASKTETIAGGQYDVSLTRSGYIEINDLAGNIEYMASAIQDREQQLLKSRERYRQLVETMNDGLSIIDQNNLIIYVNPALSKMLGYSPEQMLGKNTLDFLDEKNRLLAIRQLSERKKNQEFAYELEWRRSDGQKIITLISPKALFESDRHIGSFAVISDITARKKAENLVKQSLQEAEEARDKIDAILKSVPLGLIVTDLMGKIILMNRSAQTTLGQQATELMSQPVTSVLRETAFQEHFTATVIGQGHEEPIDLDLYDHGLGQIRTIQVSSSLVQTQQEFQTGVVIVLNDVSGERESDRLKSEFIATAAHELSTPLTAIMGYAELLVKQDELGGFPSKQLKEFYKTIHDRGEALSRITEDLLHLSHMESGRNILLEKKPHIIEDTIQEIVNLYRMESPDRCFKVQLGGQKNLLNMDRGRVIQVLENLIGNAVKYSDAGGTIAVEGVRQEDCYRITIVDDGIGMSEDQVDRIFEKFYRANPMRASISGLGMGMTIVKNIVDAHNGQIEVKSQPGRGTRVMVTLPLD